MTTLPVTVLSGYLGSGKTTLVNNLLRQADGLKLAVLVNDFGDLAIDADLIEAQDEDVISIAGGCVCCSYGNDLSLALLNLFELDQTPDHVLIEASGVAIPSAVASSLSLISGFETNGIISLVDVETIQKNARHKYMADTVIKQIQDADILIMNKIDLVDEAAAANTQSWLQDQAPNAIIHASSHAKVPLSLILGMKAGPVDHIHAHTDSTSLDMMVVETAQPIDTDFLASHLRAEALGIVRAKGFIKNAADRPTLLQQVGKRCEFSQAESYAQFGLVFLGFKDELQKSQISEIVDNATLKN